MPVIIFMDIQMFVMEGFEFLDKSIKFNADSNIYNIKIAMLTSSLNDSDKLRSQQCKNVMA